MWFFYWFISFTFKLKCGSFGMGWMIGFFLMIFSIFVACICGVFDKDVYEVGNML